MKERLITSAVIVLFLIIVGLINNIYLTKLVIAVIAIVSMIETKRLFGIENEKILYFLSVLAVFSVFFNPLLLGVIGVLSVAGYVAFYQKEINLVSLSIYPFLPLMILEYLYEKSGMGILVWLIVIVAVTDSAAYVIGKNFARKFISQGFSPTSPNKSWEGVIGGVVCGSFAGALVGVGYFDFFTALFVSFFVSVAGVFGDLFESFLKRRAGVKDSGNILPGHGGILDRIDGYLFASPLLWVVILTLGNI